MSTILITGCSSGLGLLTALEFARAGDDVYAGVRDLDTADHLRGSARDGQLKLNIVGLDVTDPSSVHDCVSRVIEEAGRIDVLVNNAAIATFAAVEDTDDDEAQRMMQTNFLGP